MSRIIFLSQLFDPEPTIKGLTFIKELYKRGIGTEVVTGFPNYPGGKLYPGHSMRWRQKEIMDGVQVTRLATYPSHDASAVKRIVCYMSFYFTALLYLLFGARKVDLIYVYYPSLTAGLSAISAKLFRRTPVVLDIQDMWPDSLGASGMMTNRILLSVVHLLCRVLYRNCDHIIVQSPGFRRLLIERGVDAEKITVIYNWADEIPAQRQPTLPDGVDPTDGVRFLFAGNMGAAQGLSAVIEAAALVAKSRSDVVFYFMGGGTEQGNLEKQSSRLGLKNVRFLPRVSVEKIQAYLAAADCLIIHLKDQPLFRSTIPSKTQAYLYAGRPILMAAPGDAADLVIQAGAGIEAIPSNAKDLAEKILFFASLSSEDREKMEKSGPPFYQSKLSICRGIDATHDVLQKVLGV